MKKWIIATVAIVASVLLSASSCESAADRADANLTKSCENFECPRRIVGVNAITDTVLFEVTGFCSYEIKDRSYEAICLTNRETGAVNRTTLGKADNVTMVVTQLQDVNVDLFRPRVIFRPETIVPNFDLSTNGNPTEPDPGGN